VNIENKKLQMICYPTHMLWWNPKAKKKYKTKKKKKKDVVMEKLVIVTQTMVGREFHDEEAQSPRTWWRRLLSLLHEIIKIKR